jgi:DNA-binding transcriptional LysR family regulator
MSAFVAVARAGGFSAAARTVGIPLPTLSRRVADLETELGVRLLHRSTRQVVLTETGETFFATCQRVLEDLKEGEEAVTGAYRAPRGELTVTAPMGFGRLHLQPVALEFLAAYPEINLRLLLIDRVGRRPCGPGAADR